MLLSVYSKERLIADLYLIESFCKHRESRGKKSLAAINALREGGHCQDISGYFPFEPKIPDCIQSGNFK